MASENFKKITPLFMNKVKELKDEKLIDYISKMKEELHQPRSRTLFESFMRALQSIKVSHQRSIDLATNTFEALKNKFPTIEPNKLITPKNLKKLPDKILKTCVAFPANQLETLKDMIELFIDEDITPKNAKKVMRILGIGKWTYNMALVLYLLNPKDKELTLELLEENTIKFPEKDLALRRGYCTVFGLEDPTKVEYKTVEDWANKYGAFIPFLTQLLWQTKTQKVPSKEERDKIKKEKAKAKREEAKRIKEEKKRKREMEEQEKVESSLEIDSNETKKQKTEK